MFIDPIVQEVRAAREKIAAECNYDIDKLMAREKEIFERYKDQFQVVTKEELDQLRLHPGPHQRGG
jgi:hypothetical protein